MREYIDELFMRLSRYNVAFELDESIAQQLINDARQKVQMSSLYVYPEKYSAITTLDLVPDQQVFNEEADLITTMPRNYLGVLAIEENQWWRLWLPNDFIEVFSVWIKHDKLTVQNAPSEYWINPNSQWFEARRVTAREIFQSTTNVITRPRPFLPSYSIQQGAWDIERQSGSFSKKYRYLIMISIGLPLADWQPNSEDVMIYYVRALPYLQLFNREGLPDVDYAIPFELQEFVIMQASIMAMMRNNAFQQAQLLSVEMEHEIAYLEEQYNLLIDKQQFTLPSREGIYQNVYVPNRGLGSNEGNNNQNR